MTIEIIQPGLLTTVQDRGRRGYFGMGIPTGGCMDGYSAWAANALVGNGPDAAVLEATYTLPSFVVRTEVVFAVTGAEVEVKVNGQPVPMWTSHLLKADDQVEFGLPQKGVRVYIALAGGVDVPEVLGSRSTYALGVGGFEGRALAAGDVVKAYARLSAARPGLSLPDAWRSPWIGVDKVRTVVGMHAERLAKESFDAFYGGAEWTLTPLGDRSGLRYSGPKIKWMVEKNAFGAGSDPSNIADSGYPMGSIQIPGGNEPIVLHRDNPTCGGYAMVGVVCTPDLDLISQGVPGSKVFFQPITRKEALEARAEYANHLRSLPQQLVTA